MSFIVLRGTIANGTLGLVKKYIALQIRALLFQECLHYGCHHLVKLLHTIKNSFHRL